MRDMAGTLVPAVPCRTRTRGSGISFVRPSVAESEDEWDD